MNKLEEISANLIVKYLKDKSEKELRTTIKQRINLAEVISLVLSTEIIKIIRIAASFYQADGVSPDVVLNLLDLQRPELTRVIRESQENYIWFKKNVIQVKRLFGIS